MKPAADPHSRPGNQNARKKDENASANCDRDLSKPKRDSGYWIARLKRDAVAKAMTDNPDATQQQIADAVGLSQSRVAEIIGELSANDSPKVLSHGGKRKKQGDNHNLEESNQVANGDMIKGTRKRSNHSNASQMITMRINAPMASLSKQGQSANRDLTKPKPNRKSGKKADIDKGRDSTINKPKQRETKVMI